MFEVLTKSYSHVGEALMYCFIHSVSKASNKWFGTKLDRDLCMMIHICT